MASSLTHHDTNVTTWQRIANNLVDYSPHVAGREQKMVYADHEQKYFLTKFPTQEAYDIWINGIPFHRNAHIVMYDFWKTFYVEAKREGAEKVFWDCYGEILGIRWMGRVNHPEDERQVKSSLETIVLQLLSLTNVE